MEEKISEIESKDINDSQVYELGYHLLPSVAEEDLPKEVAKIHSIVSELEGNTVSEGAPGMRQLAYDLAKKVGTKSLKFNKAYFGWLKFEMEPVNAVVLKAKMENLENVLRFIILKTVKENTMYIPKAPSFKREPIKEDGVAVESVEKAPASEEEIDKSIDELVIEN